MITAESERAIELLQERRTALISAAETGRSLCENSQVEMRLLCDNIDNKNSWTDPGD
jgi:hypothetical protein